MKTNFRVWAQRDLSTCGKILISKSYISLTMLESESKIIKVAQQEINSFIWNFKIVEVKHTSLIADNSYLGLRSIDVCSQQKALRFP